MEMKVGYLILSGGKSRRMGRKKELLRLGEDTFLGRLIRELGEGAECLVSVDQREDHEEAGIPMVEDLYRDCGPMSGIYSALLQCRSEALVTVPCDVPLFSRELAERLAGALREEMDAVVSVTKDGRLHPLCGIYRKSCLPVLKGCLEEKRLRMMDALAQMQVGMFFAGEDSWQLRNINTPQDYRELTGEELEKNDVPILAVCGWKNSGKTTLLEKLISIFCKQGLRVAAIKHEGHCFEADVPGTDSWRYLQAGAESSLIFDQEKFSLTQRGRFDAEAAERAVKGADLVLLEGFKYSDYPKLELVRRGTGQPPIEGLTNRLAYVTDWGEEALQEGREFLLGLPVLDMNREQEIADFIMKAWREGKLYVPKQQRDQGGWLSSGPQGKGAKQERNRKNIE